MRKATVVVMVLVIVMAVLVPAKASAQDSCDGIYWSPEIYGNDSNSGLSWDQPLSSYGLAEQRTDGPVYVVFLRYGSGQLIPHETYIVRLGINHCA